MGNTRQNPYLSIVIYTRNDSYGGKRHQAGIKGILLQAERHHLRSELILVEWNPPPDKPLLKDVFPWPQRSGFCTIRNIVVPASIHARYNFSDKYPIHMMAAWNVGIRRARGEFILLATCDILMSDEVVEFLASEKLDKDAMYRISTHEVLSKVARLSTLEEQLISCQRAIVRLSEATTCYFGSTEAPILKGKGRGEFILLSRERFCFLHGAPEIYLVGLHCDSILVYMAYLSGARETILHEPMRIYHINHDQRRSNRAKILHLAEGIYTWHIWPKRLASLLRLVIYQPLAKLFPPKNELHEMGIPYLSPAQYQSIVLDMIKGKRSYIFNDKNWGLGQESLEEFVIRTADWDKGYEKV
jgi:hypothetical protein